MPSSRDQQREETRRRLYDAALDLFRRDGVEAARIDEIASQVGVSRATFYFHFPSRGDVLLARMRETEDEIAEAVEALGDTASLRDVLGCVNATMAGIWEADPTLLPDVAGHALRYAAEHMEDREASLLRTLLTHWFERALRDGEIGVPLPAEALGDLYLGNIMGGLLAWFASRSMPLQTMLDGVTWLFWNGAGASTGE